MGKTATWVCPPQESCTRLSMMSPMHTTEPITDPSELHSPNATISCNIQHRQHVQVGSRRYYIWSETVPAGIAVVRKPGFYQFNTILHVLNLRNCLHPKMFHSNFCSFLFPILLVTFNSSVKYDTALTSNV